MSYTSEDLVRRHLAPSRPIQAMITDQTVILPDNAWLRFSSGPVEGETVRVKRATGETLSRQTVTLLNGSAVLATGPIASGSVLVASDSSLGHIFAEGADYIVDSTAATLSVRAGGELDPNATVTVWLRKHHLFLAGIDFSLRPDTGEIKRLAGGAIAAGETVLLDYSPLYAAHDDLIVAAAVAEANGLIAAAIDPDRSFGADPMLQTAATCTALGIVCRSAAARALGTNPADDRGALAWIKLAELYAERAEMSLKKFRPPHPGPSGPKTT